MFLVCLILGSLSLASVVLYKSLELAVTGVQEHVVKSSAAEAHVLANKFVALLHAIASVTFAIMVLATFPYGTKPLLALKHKGEHPSATLAHVFVSLHGCNLSLHP